MIVTLGNERGKDYAAFKGKKYFNMDNPDIYSLLSDHKHIVDGLKTESKRLVEEYNDESKNKYRRTQHKVAKGKVFIIDKVLEILCQ